MKQLSKSAIATLSAMALVAFTATSAPATTLEVAGATKSESVTIAASLKSGTSALLKDTLGITANTCTESTAEGKTSSPYTGTTVTGPIETLTFGKCTREPVVVHKAGTLHISHIAGTTNGTATSSGAEVTVPSPFGTLNCKTGESTHLGTLTGGKEGHAEIHINATIPCGLSTKWTATYTVTSPTGLGVSG